MYQFHLVCAGSIVHGVAIPTSVDADNFVGVDEGGLVGICGTSTFGVYLTNTLIIHPQFYILTAL